MSLSENLAALVPAAQQLETSLTAEQAARAEADTRAAAAEQAMADHMTEAHPTEPEPEPVDPLQVQNVRHQSQTATEFVAEWDAVAGATHYDVFVDVAEDGTGGWRFSRKTAPQTTQGFPNQTPGQTRRITVAAVVDGVVQARATPATLSTLEPSTEPEPDPEPQPPAGTRLATLHPFLSAAFSNTSVGSGAVYVDEPAFRIGGADVNCERWSFPVFVAKPTDQTFTIVDDNNRSFTLRIPAAAEAAGGTDAHMNVFQADGRTSYEMWGAVRTSNGWDARYVVRTDALGTGMGAGARASGVSHLHGVIRAEELLAGRIRHTLCIAADNDQLKMGPVWPAQNEDGNASSTYRKDGGGFSIGTMFGIPPSVDVTKLGITTKAGLALAHAAQDYGGHILLRAANTNLFCETSVATRAPQELADLRAAWPILRPLMRKITNNTASNVAGGGTRRDTPLPEVTAG